MENRDRLLQEEYIDTEWGPWKVIIICQCLNLTTWKQAEPALKTIFERWPNPDAVASLGYEGYESELKVFKEVLKPLGFVERRTLSIIAMSDAWWKLYQIHGDDYPKWDIRFFRGVGEYAHSAWNLFVLKRACAPKDERLKWYAQREGLYAEGTFWDRTKADVGFSRNRAAVSKLPHEQAK